MAWIASMSRCVFDVIVNKYRVGSLVGFQKVCGVPRSTSTADPAVSVTTSSPTRTQSEPSSTYQASSHSRCKCNGACGSGPVAGHGSHVHSAMTKLDSLEPSSVPLKGARNIGSSLVPLRTSLHPVKRDDDKKSISAIAFRAQQCRKVVHSLDS